MLSTPTVFYFPRLTVCFCLSKFHRQSKSTMLLANKGRWILSVLLVFLSACSQLATVKNVTPTPPSVSTPSGISLADKREADRNPASALSRDLDVASHAWTQLNPDPANLQARHLYNYSVGRIVSLLQATGELPRAGAVRIGTGSNTYLLTYGSDIKYVA